jgi:uncharacterized protein (DUF2225 family)
MSQKNLGDQNRTTKSKKKTISISLQQKKFQEIEKPKRARDDWDWNKLCYQQNENINAQLKCIFMNSIMFQMLVLIDNEKKFGPT